MASRAVHVAVDVDPDFDAFDGDVDVEPLFDLDLNPS
jgi:hypothetical protein